jgi:hypothetical protein
MKPTTLHPLFAQFAIPVLLASASLNSAWGGTYSEAVLADSPIAYYRLDETSGTTAVNLGTAGAAANGTYVNIPSVTNLSDYGLPGPRGGYPGFESTNNSVFFAPEVGSMATSNLFPRVEVVDDVGGGPLAVAGAVTLEAWIRRLPGEAGTGTNEGIVGRYMQDHDTVTAGAQAGRSYVLYFESTTDGTVYTTDDGGPGIGIAFSSNGAFHNPSSAEFGTPGVDYTKWTHVVTTIIPGERFQVFVNGSMVGEVVDDDVSEVAAGIQLHESIYTGPADLWIGQQFNGDDDWTFRGLIDEVAIYDYALTPAQIAAHYAAAVPEPGTWSAVTLAMAGAGLFVRGRRRKQD